MREPGLTLAKARWSWVSHVGVHPWSRDEIPPLPLFLGSLSLTQAGFAFGPRDRVPGQGDRWRHGDRGILETSMHKGMLCLGLGSCRTADFPKAYSGIPGHPLVPLPAGKKNVEREQVGQGG